MKIDTELKEHYFWDLGRQGKIFVGLVIVIFVFFGVIQETHHRFIYEELIWLWKAFPRVDNWFFNGVLGIVPESFEEKTPNLNSENFIGVIPILILFFLCFAITYSEDIYIYGFRLAVWLVPFIIGCSIFWYYYINILQTNFGICSNVGDDLLLVNPMTWPNWDCASQQGRTIYQWTEPPNPFYLLFGRWEGWVNIAILLVINVSGSYFGWQFKELIRIYVKHEKPMLKLSQDEFPMKNEVEI